MDFKQFFGISFCALLIFFGYCLWVFGALKPIDELFEINTRFRNNDLQEWLAPQRAHPSLSRFGENRSSGVEPRYIKPAVLHECLLADEPCVDMLGDIAPAKVFWKTATDIYLDKATVQAELVRALKGGKFKDASGRVIKSKELLLAELKEELSVLQAALDTLSPHYRSFGLLYTIWNYTPVTFFTFLHYSRIIAQMPSWIKEPLNRLAAWYMEHKYPQIKEDAKKLIKEKTTRFFHWIVDKRVDKTFRKIQTKAAKHLYIHDYSPYYHKLQYDFDLEAKNVYDELVRLIDRNKALKHLIIDDHS